MKTLIRLEQYLKLMKMVWSTWEYSHEAHKHAGDRYECPFCGFHSKDLALSGYDSLVSRKYATVGMGGRWGTCWKCRAQDREKLLYLYLRDIENIFDGHPVKMLHIAPEYNIAKRILEAKNVDYTCGDYFAKGYMYPPYVQNMNVLCLPSSDNTFDIVMCNHVFEHIEDDKKAMTEIYRVLKNGGRAILQVPISKQLDKTLEDPVVKTAEERFLKFGQSDHLRLYGLDYQNRLENCGFRVELVKFPIDTIEKYGLNKEEDIYVCHKELDS